MTESFKNCAATAPILSLSPTYQVRCTNGSQRREGHNNDLPNQYPPAKVPEKRRGTHGDQHIGANSIATGQKRVEKAKHSPAKPGDHFDVIIIGGGMAGLTAVRDCALRGVEALVLEARNRIGGRAFISEYAGKHVELGGTWIHWSQGFVWKEVSRYDLGKAGGGAPMNLQATGAFQGWVSRRMALAQRYPC